MTPLLHGGVYSGAYNDPNNGYDAPVPGFVGPDGDGVAPLSDGSHADNYLNPVFTGWASAGSEETGAVPGVVYAPAEVDRITWYFAYPGMGTGPLNFADTNVIADPDDPELEAYGIYTVSLGELTPNSIIDGVEPGYITLWFEEPIHNVPGADLAVYENGFISGSDQGGYGAGGVFAELAFVEVSSDGDTFARFPSISLTTEANKPGRYGSMDPSLIYNLAGKHVNSGTRSWGTPFDLSMLANEENVLNGSVDLNNIRFVRIVDVCGIGVYTPEDVSYIGALDSLGNVIYDPYMTTGSGGFDLDAIGAVGQAIDYEEWDAGRGLLPDEDYDRDGVINLLEYAFDMEPTVSDLDLLPQVEMVEGHLTLTFRRDVRNADIIYIIEAIDSLEDSDWQEVARCEAFTTPWVTATDDDGMSISTQSRHTEASLGVWQKVCYTDKALDSMRFLRVRVDTVD